MLFIYIIKMQSIIFTFVDSNWEECTSIGSKHYYEKEIGKCKQQICYCILDHEQNDRDYMVWLSKDELYFALNQYIKNNKIKVFYLQ